MRVIYQRKTKAIKKYSDHTQNRELYDIQFGTSGLGVLSSFRLSSKGSWSFVLYISDINSGTATKLIHQQKIVRNNMPVRTFLEANLIMKTVMKMEMTK